MLLFEADRLLDQVVGVSGRNLPSPEKPNGYFEHGVHNFWHRDNPKEHMFFRVYQPIRTTVADIHQRRNL